jgi:phage/plasmid-associated DNA primase
MDDSDISFNLPPKNEQLQVLLTIIGETYFKDENNWKFVGECIKNVLGSKGYDLFTNYTPSEFADNAESTWNTFKKTRYGLKSIKYIAETTNKEGFQDWKHTIMFAAGIGALKKTAKMTEIADIAKFLYDHRMICTNTVSQSWYHFNGTCWERMSGGESIKQKFSREMAKVFESIYHEMNSMDQEDPDIKAMTKKAAEITRDLKDPGPKAALMRECSEIFLIRDFESNIDEDHYILGMPNGVLVMRDFKNIHFRRAYPDDWIGLQTGAEYHPEIYSWDHPDVKYVMNFKKQIVPDDETREFVLKHKGSCLMGGNKDKLCIINIGESAHNGKSTDATFDRQTFGTYSGKLPLGVVSGATPKANEVNPAIVMTKGTRLQQLDEASKKQEFNAAFMKLATGNDEQWARLLYSNGGSFIPQYNLVMSCNSPPSRIESAGDSGMDERLVLVPHVSRFTSNAPESIKEQWEMLVFKADPHIKNELKARVDAHMWILVQYLIKYLDEGLKKPKNVVDKTNKYQYSNNPYKQFVNDKLDVSGRAVDYVTLQDLYTNFKLWFLEAFPNKRTENREGFSEEIAKTIGPHTGDDKRYHGIKIKTEAKRYDRGPNK